MPSVDGEDTGDEEVERSPNRGENMSEDDEMEDSSSSGSEESSSDSGSLRCVFCFVSVSRFLRHLSLMIPLFLAVDEAENERRRMECLDDMADLERQFTDLKEQ